MSEIGHNDGPPIQKFTAKQKIERIKEVLDLQVLTPAQKCVGVGIICEADTDWITPELSTADLQRFASVKDRETVYKATRELGPKGAQVAKTMKGVGRANRYIVLPSAAIDAALDEIDVSASRVEPDLTSPIEPDWLPSPIPVGLNPTTPVGSNPTSPIEPDGLNPTGRVETDWSEPDCPRARGLDLTNTNKLIKTDSSLKDREEEKDRGCGGKEKPHQEKFDLGAEGTPDEKSTPAEEAADEKASPLEAFNLYNDMALRAAIPQARTLTPQRRRLIAARMREHGGIEAWKTALANIEKSAFLRGNNDRGWTAGLDFLCQASSFTKCVEGHYGNGAHGPAPAGPSRPRVTDSERIAQIARELDEEERQKKASWMTQS